CQVNMCPAGRGDCDRISANGCEVDTNTDPTNCGTCGAACAFPNAGASCAAGACQLGACAAGFANCNAMAVDGCEANTPADPAHCGVCATSCAPNTNASAVCLGGSCGVACGPSFANCDGNLGNGCETNVGGDPNNCGGCGVVCPQRPNSAPTCVAGQCRFNC